MFDVQKSLQAGREYTNIRYSTEGGLTPATCAQSQPLESPTGKSLSKSTLSLASVSTPLLSAFHVTVSKSEKPHKETKGVPSRTVTEHPIPM